MSRFLILDIGAGTLDILYHDTRESLHYKAVVKSPVKRLTEKATREQGNLLIVGREMGGGALSRVLREKSRESEVVMSVSAAATINHNLDKVRSWGIKVRADKEADALAATKGYSVLTAGDLELERLREIIKAFGVSFSFDVVGICAQDHGRPPQGVSHLDYRHSVFKAKLQENPFPHALLYRHDEIPATLSRLKSLAESAQLLPAEEIYVMDSGMAAILGASMDSQAAKKERVLVLDVATSHTVGAALEGQEISGFFEYHTQDITLERLEGLLCDLADGKLEHRRILEEGGHGAYIRRSFGYDATEIIVATGPKRALIKGSKLPMVLGAPLGDNMMTGTAGVLEAIRRRRNSPPWPFT
jgi:uncharacterized protein (DUF1786 family)